MSFIKKMILVFTWPIVKLENWLGEVLRDDS